MGRPRIIPDARVLEAAKHVVANRGPQQFTLSDVAKEAGLSPATLVQRFGSKRGLMLALAEAAATDCARCFEAIRADHRSPLKALYASVDSFAQMAQTPEQLSNALAFLQVDLSDPEFRKWTVKNTEESLRAFKSMLDDAVGAGELKPCDTKGLARLIGAGVHGSMLSWTIFQKGTAKNWIRRDLRSLLAPYLPTVQKKSARSRAVENACD